jgi:transcriptional regulator with XRE-family HTH domain
MPEPILPDQGPEDQPRRPRPRRQRVRRAAHSDEQWVRGPELRALATAVRETRARRRLSQEELGFRAGMHRNDVGAIERAEINPTFRILLKLCRGLAVAPSELIVLYEKRRPELADEPPPPHGQMTGRRNSAPPRSVRAAGSRLKAQRTGPSPTGQPPAPRSSSAEPPRRAPVLPA